MKISTFKSMFECVSVVLMLILVQSTAFSQSQNNSQRGIFESYVILSINNGDNAFYDMQATTDNPNFNGSNLGSFCNTASIIVKGGQNKTYKNSGCNITNGDLFYRVWSGAAAGSFTQINLPFAENLVGVGDQRWQGESGTTNILTGLAAGTYTLEVYTRAQFNACGFGDLFSSNSGTDNYRATFTVLANPAITSATAAANPICANATTDLTANGIAGDGATLTWYTGAGGSGTNLGSSNPLTNRAPGTYYARVTGTCSPAVEASITINSISPNINVQGNSTTIADGDATPSLADHTNFSSVATGTGFTRTFTIQNTGTAALSITGTSVTGTNASEFVVTTAPASSVAAAGSTTFVVTFTPTAPGTRTATINIASNDCDEAAYDFAVQGTGCASLVLASSLDAATTSVVDGANPIFTSGDACKALVGITPNGDEPVSGSVNAKVWVQPSTPTFNSRPYLRRHYEITPATNEASATARITLYATQSDFDAFNDFNPNGADLPTRSDDAIGIAELRIYKYSGTSNDGTGTPCSYPQPGTVIDPADANIIWNSTLSRWEISFDVTGFSGFFMGNSANTILPLQLISFTGSKQAAGNMLSWQTANEQNTKRFELERSANGSSFARIATIAAAGAGSHRYSHTDAATQHGTVWYRLKMIDADGKFSYSPVVIIQPNANNAIALFPNPAKNLVNIQVGNRTLLNTTAQVMDAKGALVQAIKLTGYNQQFNVAPLAKGMYLLKLADGTVLRFVKE
jgi:hypothetical protein